MPDSQKWIFFLNAFGMGLLAPVISLILLSHGAVTGTLSVFTGLVAASVMVLELPSGVFADTAGRKHTFLLAVAARLACLILLILARGPILLGAACLLLGASQAFASGSLEVFAVEQAMGRNTPLAAVHGTIAALEGCGMVLGSALGGILGSFGSSYTLLLAAALGCGSAVLILTLAGVREAPRKKPAASAMGQLAQIRQAVRQTNLLRILLAMAALTGMIQAVLEIYWQQRFQLLAPGSLRWTIGLIGTLGYLGVIAGSKAAAGLLDRLEPGRVYWACKFLLTAAMAGLGLCRNWLLFSVLYGAVYALLGAADVAERTLLHCCISDTHRAGLLSVYSLVLRFGVILSSAAAAILVPRVGVSALWYAIPAAAFLGMILLYKTQPPAKPFVP